MSKELSTRWIVVLAADTAKEIRRSSRRNIKKFVGMRPDFDKGNFLGFQSGIFSATSNFFSVNFSRLSVGYRAEKEENSGWLKFAFQTKIHLVKSIILKRCVFHARGHNEACGQALESLSSREQGRVTRV